MRSYWFLCSAKATVLVVSVSSTRVLVHVLETKYGYIIPFSSAQSVVCRYVILLYRAENMGCGKSDARIKHRKKQHTKQL